MIEWGSLLANSLWIFGLAVLLARFSFASAHKAVPRERPQASNRIDWPQMVGLVLFCLGMLLTADARYEQILWGLLMIASLVVPWWEHRRRVQAP